LLAIGLTWVGLRVYYWNGYYTEDAPGYVSDAISLALREYHARNHVNGLNIGTYAPVAIPIALLGKSEVALSLWPLFCSLLAVVSLAGAAALVFGRPFGLLAAVLYATYPGDVFFSTVVMPDAIQAGWLSFSIFLIALAHAGSDDRRRWTLAAGGVAMGCCHLIRANDPILIPVGVSAVVILSQISARETRMAGARSVLAYLSGWALVVTLEGLAYLWAAHDFLLRLHVVNRHYGTIDSIRRWGLNTDPTTIPFSAFAPVTWRTHGNWGLLNQDQAYHALIFSLALASVVAGAVVLVSRRRQVPDRGVAGFAVAALWFAWPLLVHQFGSQSLTHFVPMHRLSRHLVVYAPGAVFATVAGGYLVAEAASTWRSASARRVLTAAVALMLLGHMYFNWRGAQVAYDAYHRIKATYVRIRERLPQGTQTMIADPGDLCFFDFWLNPLGVERVKTAVFANYSRCDELTSGVVLTQSNPGWEGLNAPVIQDTVERLPCLLHPPAKWHLVYDGYPEKVYRIE
jgi:4-amino-4-deoxy-L-arabinose transferase-like glycosyltransferase